MLIAAILAAPAATARPAAAQRALQDRRDQVGPYQVHVVYFVPKDAPDERLDVNGTLDGAVRRMQAWFSTASGGLSWRIDTFGPTRQTDVTFVRGRHANAAYRAAPGGVFGGVTAELAASGMTVQRTKKRYLVFYAGDTRDDGLCGMADYPIYSPRTYTPARDAGVLLGGSFAMAFLKASPVCRSGDVGRGGIAGWLQTSMMHELVHTEGLTAPGAPHTCDPTGLVSGGHVCGLSAATLATSALTEGIDPERRDLMFPFVNMPLSEKSLDGGRDDYFRAGISSVDLSRSAFVVGPGTSAARGPVVAPVRVERHGDRGAHHP